MALLKSANDPKRLTPPAIWTSFAKQGRWKNAVLAGQFFFIVLLLLVAFVLAGRPPDVVLVTPDGKSTYVQASVASEPLARWVAEQKHAPSDVTLLHFSKQFLTLALAVNSSTIESTWPEALSLMSPPLRDRLSKQAAADKLVETTRAAKVQTDVVIDDVLALEHTKDFVHLRTKVTRAKSSILSDSKTLDHVVADLVLRVVPRSLAHPDGLQVAEWTMNLPAAATAEPNEAKNAAK